MKTIYLLLLAFSLIVFASCRTYSTSPLDEPFKKVLATISDTDTTAYRLDSLIDFDWDRLIILTSYYNKELLKTQCGLVSELPDSDIDVNEGPSEYIFIKSGKILSHHITPDRPNSIVATFGGYPYEELKSSCGLPNTPKTFIKIIPNRYPEWKGKTFMIFLKG